MAVWNVVLEFLDDVSAKNASGCSQTACDPSPMESAESKEVAADSCLVFRVEACALTLFLACSAVENLAKVRKMAVQQWCCLQQKYGTTAPLPILRNFQSMLEQIRKACAGDWVPFWDKVCLLQTLQVRLSITMSIHVTTAPGAPQTVCDPQTRVRSVAECLANNTLSKEKEVLITALTCDSVLGRVCCGKDLDLCTICTCRFI